MGEMAAKQAVAVRRAKAGPKFVIDEITCEVDEDKVSIMSNLKVDQKVTLKGMSGDMWFLHPHLKHCEVVAEN